MSQGMTTAPRKVPPIPTSKQDTADIVSHLDRKLSRLHHLLPSTQPYLLSIPTDVPYRHSSRFRNTWHEGTPFDRTEEQLQYVSFLPHQHDHESLLKVEGGWADDDGNHVEQHISPKPVPASGHNTPAAPANRKKITLKDYRTKSRNSPDRTQRQHSAPPAPKDPPAHPRGQIDRQPTAAHLPTETGANGVVHGIATNLTETKPRHAGPSSPSSPKKSTSTSVTQPPLATPSNPPPKRRKLSPAFEELQPKRSRSPSAKSPAMAMPRLLSPTLPSAQERGLPQLLSPVLPASLTKALLSPPGTVALGSPAGGPVQRSDQVRSILARADIDENTSAGRQAAPALGSRARSESQNSTQVPLPGSPVAATITLGSKVIARAHVTLKSPSQNGVRASPGPRQRHTISLKYGKKNRKRVEALLKFAPRPKKETLTQEARPGQSRAAATDANTDATIAHDTVGSDHRGEQRPKREPSAEVTNDKKRKAEPESDVALKKVKAASRSTIEVDQRPSTPVPPIAKTPLTSHARSAFSTPKKDLKASAMRRVESSEGADAPTPVGDKARVSTPVAMAKPSPQSGSASSGRGADRQEWTNLNTKFFTLGRTLKHEGSAILDADQDPKSPQTVKGVLTGIEALLCFMINIAAQAQARPGPDPGWRSIVLYHIFLFRVSRKFPHLHGLVVQLGAVCRQLILKCDLDRLARDPLPEDHCHSAPTPGSDGNTKTNSDDGEKYKKRYLEFRDGLVQNAHELQTAWLDGSRLLSPDVLRRDYPHTWAGRATDTSSRLHDKPTPSRLGKAYYLPMDANTTAFEAVRFAASFLQEWADKEQIEWKPRIDL